MFGDIYVLYQLKKLTVFPKKLLKRSIKQLPDTGTKATFETNKKLGMQTRIVHNSFWLAWCGDTDSDWPNARSF
jgi:hypothetical protein